MYAGQDSFHWTQTIRLGGRSLYLLNCPWKCSNTWAIFSGNWSLEINVSSPPDSHLIKINSPLSPARPLSYPHSSPAERSLDSGPWCFLSYLLVSSSTPFVDKLNVIDCSLISFSCWPSRAELKQLGLGKQPLLYQAFSSFPASSHKRVTPSPYFTTHSAESTARNLASALQKPVL